MLSSSLRRVGRPFCPLNNTSSRAVRPAASLVAIYTQSNQPSYQRRQSSSKTSIPPDGSKRAALSQQTSSSTGRISRKKTKEPALLASARNQLFSKQYPNLPSVPSTQHLGLKEINVSSFFSLHRPISVTTAVPRASTEAQFNRLFEPRTISSRKKYTDVLFTLNSLVKNLDPFVEQDDGNGLNWQVLQESPKNHGESRHLDSVPRDLPIEKIISQFRPHKPPPPPQPWSGPTSSAAPRKKTSSKALDTSLGQKRSTLIVLLTEYTDDSGEKSYAASNTPIIRVPSNENKVVVHNFVESYKPYMRQPFLDRMRVRQQRWEDSREDRAEKRREMHLISVKRQRKLKMKKHKYKKLMKRTRNERRKLGKL